MARSAALSSAELTDAALPQNFSRNIRMALFYDFVSEDLRARFPRAATLDPAARARIQCYECDENSEQRPAGQRSSLSDGPPPPDMWADWCAALRTSPEPPALPELGPPKSKY
eukprot:SAG11_NODE_4233_length_1997_cov_1.303477_4_plen_113_part_00